MGEGRDLAIVGYGNGIALSRRAAARLADEGIAVRIIDLRWLTPSTTRPCTTGWPTARGY